MAVCGVFRSEVIIGIVRDKPNAILAVQFLNRNLRTQLSIKCNYGVDDQFSFLGFIHVLAVRLVSDTVLLRRDNGNDHRAAAIDLQAEKPARPAAPCASYCYHATMLPSNGTFELLGIN